ncbi:MAG: hypothetical protein Q7R92_01650 [bacterium]|nr:hypothetical protein [bacterium]
MDQDKVSAMQKFVQLARDVERAIEHLDIMDQFITGSMDNSSSPLPLILTDAEYRKSMILFVTKLLNCALAIISDNLSSAQDVSELMEKIKETDALILDPDLEGNAIEQELTGKCFTRIFRQDLCDAARQIIDNLALAKKRQDPTINEEEFKKIITAKIYGSLKQTLFSVGCHIGASL